MYKQNHQHPDGALMIKVLHLVVDEHVLVGLEAEATEKLRLNPQLTALLQEPELRHCWKPVLCDNDH